MAIQGYQVLAFIFGILAVVLNGVLLASMYKERKKIFVTRISWLVANVAIADFLNGLFLIILIQPIDDIQFAESEAKYDVTLPFVWTAFCASFFTIFLMAADRLVVVTLPMVWSTLLSIPRTILCIVLVWLLSIGAGVAIHYHIYYAQFFICLFVEIIALGFIATHVYILWILRRRERSRVIASQDPSQATPCLETPSNENIAHRKVTIVIIILMSMLIVTTVPYFVCLQMFTTQNTFDDTVASKVSLSIYAEVFSYSDALLYVNFLLNPIIYAWRLRMYRKAFYSLLGQSSS